MASTIKADIQNDIHNIETIMIKVEEEDNFIEETNLFDEFIKEVSTYSDYKCSACTNKYPFKELLNMHLEVHKDLNISALFNCTVCNKFETKGKRDFTVHINKHIKQRLAELKNTSFICKICNLQCRCRSKLAIHVKVHTGDSPFVCYVCDKGFKTKFSLRYHLNTHDESKDESTKCMCNDCGGTFANMSSLRRHIRKFHNDDKIIVKRCPAVNCNMTFPCRQSLDRHKLEKHTEKLFECKICKKPFFLQSSRRKHISKVHGHIPDRPKCRFCGETFADVFRIHDHYITAHFKANPEVVAEWNRTKRYSCTACKKPRSFSSFSLLTKHFQYHVEKNLLCENCSSGPYSYSEFKKHKFMAHDSIVCEICSETLVGHKSLEHHVRYKHSKKIFEYNRLVALQKMHCKYCHMKCTSIKLLQNHLQSTHNVGVDKIWSHLPRELLRKSLECTICKQMVPSRESFANHMATHREMAYNCRLCNKKIFSKSGLLKHARICCKREHFSITGNEEDITCNICKKSFANSQILKEHIITDHSTAKQNHECKMCKAEFVSRGDFIKHILKQHFETYVERENDVKDYHKCRMCKIIFSDNKNLIEHITTQHSQVRILQCSTCYKAFFMYREYFRHVRHAHKRVRHECTVCHKQYATRSILNTHILSMHPGTSPYVCDICNEGFPYQKEYLRHIRKTHNGVRRHSCNICELSFMSAEGLVVHKTRKHSKGVRYKCKYCKKRFFFVRRYWKHMRSAHSNSEIPISEVGLNLCETNTADDNVIDFDKTRVKVEALPVIPTFKDDFENCESERETGISVRNIEEHIGTSKIKVESLSEGFTDDYASAVGLDAVHDNIIFSDDGGHCSNSEVMFEAGFDYIDTPEKVIVERCSEVEFVYKSIDEECI